MMTTEDARLVLVWIFLSVTVADSIDRSTVGSGCVAMCGLILCSSSVGTIPETPDQSEPQCSRTGLQGERRLAL